MLARALLLAGVLGWSRSAEGATLLVTRIAGDDASEAVRARADLLKAVSRIPGVVIAPLFKVEKVARAANLDPLDLANAPAALALGRAANLTAILGGSIAERNHRRVLFLHAFDRTGRLIYRGNLDLAVGQLLPEELERVADELESALASEQRPAQSRRVVVARAAPEDSPEAPPEASPQAEMEEHARRSAAPAPALPAVEGHRAEAAPPSAPERPDRFEDPAFQVELGMRESTLSSSLVDDSQIGGCAAGETGCLSNLGSSLYPGLVGRLQAFPFHARLDALAGLGVAVSGSAAELRLAAAAPGQMLTARDLRLAGDFVYRLQLGFIGGNGTFTPSLGARAGFQLRDFDVPPSGLPIHSLDRLGVRVGAEALEPLGHSLRLVLSAELSVAPTPGGEVETTLQSRQTFSDGYEFACELQVRVGAGLTGSLRAAYSELNDCFERSGAQGCDFSGKEVSADVDAMIGYAFY